MAKPESFPITQIYIPVKRRAAVDPNVVRELAESILEIGQQTPILVRRDGDRLVLVEGLHRLEACKALGEDTIIGCVVEAEPRHHGPASAYEADAEALRRKTERLRMLRLEKQAADRVSAPSAAPAADATASRARDNLNRSGSGSSKSKKQATLLEWLAEREHDGFRH